MQSPGLWPILQKLRHAVNLGAKHEGHAIEFVQSVSKLIEITTCFLEPDWACKISACEKVDAFDFGLLRQVIEGEIFSGGARLWGV